MGEVKLTKAEWQMREEFRLHWADFCDADTFPGAEDFAERMESAGWVELVPVTSEALDNPFAYELGIEPGGLMWALTPAGRALLEKQP